MHGFLEDLDVLTQAATAADGVVHMAYGGDFANPEPMMRRDVNAITALGTALQGTGKPLVTTSGTLVMPVGQDAAETDAADPDGLAVPGQLARIFHPAVVDHVRGEVFVVCC